MERVPVRLGRAVSGKSLTEALFAAADSLDLATSVSIENKPAYLLDPARREDVYDKTVIRLEEYFDKSRSGSSWFANLEFVAPLPDSEVSECTLERRDTEIISGGYNDRIIAYLDRVSYLLIR